MTTPLPRHDVQKLLASLRDHLARHDTPIAFLFGAGTSCAVQVPSPNGGSDKQPLVPDVAGLTAVCQTTIARLGPEFARAWTVIASQCKPKNRPVNIEDILSRLHLMLGAVGTEDTLAGLNETQISQLTSTIRGQIARLANFDISLVPNDIPHRKFAHWAVSTPRLLPVQIFTVNYDVLIEMSLETERVPFFDGFVGSYRPFFYPDSLRHADAGPGKNWSRLWKMHGSLTWHRVMRDGRVQIVRGDPDESGEMILPSHHKYDESRQQPYVAFMDQLTRFLELDGALLITCGYSFSDEHINSLIFTALSNRPRTHVYALQYTDPAETTDLVQASYQRHNLVVAGPAVGVVGGVRGAWRESTRQGTFPGTVADPEEPGTSTSHPGQNTPDLTSRTSRLTIGDFSHFCQFLANMT